jgi:hypothetical protein
VSVPILVTAFCRPALTVKAISAIVELKPNSEVVVSQDGKIPGFYENEHEITRRALIELARKYPQVRLNLRDINLGFTQHLIDVLQEILKSYNSAIFLEEDMQICGKGLTFLESIENDLGVSHRSAYSTTGHPNNNDPMAFRLSYFPEQWGISINTATFERFVEEYAKKQIDRRTVRTVVGEARFGKLKSEFLVDFWTGLLRQEINSPHGWDALLQWTLWKNQSPSKVSIESHVIDLGGGVGAITSRAKVESLPQIVKLKHSNATGLCIYCEQQDVGRRGFSAVSQLRARAQVRTNVKTFLEMRRYK